MKTIEQQTGWKRPIPTMICQELDVLLSISEYSFDLNDPDFVSYFESRTGNMITLEKVTRQGDRIPKTAARWEYTKWLLSSNAAERWLLESPDYVRTDSGDMVPFGKEREQDVNILRIREGKLQDCWELFTREK